jgi:hypothetical protein
VCQAFLLSVTSTLTKQNLFLQTSPVTEAFLIGLGTDLENSLSAIPQGEADALAQMTQIFLEETSFSPRSVRSLLQGYCALRGSNRMKFHFNVSATGKSANRLNRYII